MLEDVERFCEPVSNASSTLKIVFVFSTDAVLLEKTLW